MVDIAQANTFTRNQGNTADKHSLI